MIVPMHNPFVPETLEGWSVLHLMYRVGWERLARRHRAERERLAEEAVARSGGARCGRDRFRADARAQGRPDDRLLPPQLRAAGRRRSSRCRAPRCTSYLEPTTSYVSIVELGHVRDDRRRFTSSSEQKHKPGSDEFEQAFDAEMETQRQRVMNRLFLDLPKRALRLLLPDEQAPRRGAELVSASRSSGARR